jgi:hypothetical protein
LSPTFSSQYQFKGYRPFIHNHFTLLEQQNLELEDVLSFLFLNIHSFSLFELSLEIISCVQNAEVNTDKLTASTKVSMDPVNKHPTLANAQLVERVLDDRCAVHCYLKDWMAAI